MNGTSDNNIKFRDVHNLLIFKGFDCRIKGDHFIYYHKDFFEIINLQPIGNKAKSYQVKQIRMMFEKNGL